MRCCKTLIIDKLSRQAWQLSAILRGMQIVFATSAFQAVWWGINFYAVDDSCDEIFISLHITDAGCCFVGHSAGTGTDDCIHWSDAEQWKEIDSTSGSYTGNVEQIFTVVHGQCAAAIGLSVIGLFIVIFVIYNPKHSTTVQMVQFALAGISSANLLGAWLSVSAIDVIRVQTWESFSDCSNSSSFPFAGYYGALVGSVLTAVLCFLTIFPARCTCFHLVEDDSIAAAIEATAEQARIHSTDNRTSVMNASLDEDGVIFYGTPGESVDEDSINIQMVMSEHGSSDSNNSSSKSHMSSGGKNQLTETC
jgi:hypothetical protein